MDMLQSQQTACSQNIETSLAAASKDTTVSVFPRVSSANTKNCGFMGRWPPVEGTGD